MTDQPNPIDAFNADKVHRVLLKAGDQFASLGVTFQQAATGALWAAIDFAAHDVEPPVIVGWLRDMADHFERGLLAKVDTPVIH